MSQLGFSQLAKVITKERSISCPPIVSPLEVSSIGFGLVWVSFESCMMPFGNNHHRRLQQVTTILTHWNF